MKKESRKPVYRVCRVESDRSGSNSAKAVELEFFFDFGTSHRPRTRVWVTYDDDSLRVHFHVEDRYVRSLAKEYQANVCRDSCVEFFVQPEGSDLYFNFEVNAGGCLLLYAVPCSTDEEVRKNQRQPVPFELVKEMTIEHSLPSRVDPEIQEPCEWIIEYGIPFALFEHYIGPLRPVAGQIWHANFYKCADDTSHPHRGMWSPIPDGGTFHRPDCFGHLVFE